MSWNIRAVLHAQRLLRSRWSQIAVGQKTQIQKGYRCLIQKTVEWFNSFQETVFRYVMTIRFKRQRSEHQEIGVDQRIHGRSSQSMFRVVRFLIGCHRLIRGCGA
jgi:hypothetical protein